MSNGINSSQGWGLLRNLVANMGGKTEVSNADVQDILDKADTNNDNVVTEDEFITCFKSSELYQSAEEQYLQAYKVISMVDGDATSMSADDITKAIEAYDKLNTPAAPSAGDTPKTGGPGNNPKAPAATQPTTPAATEPTAPTGADGNALALESKELQELRAEKSNALVDLTSAKLERSTAMSECNGSINAARENSQVASQNFADIVAQQAEVQGQVSEQAQAVLDLQSEKTSLNEDMTAQQGVVDSANAAVSQLNSSLSGLVAPPQYETYYDEETKTNKTRTNLEYADYLAKKADLEAQLEAAEADLDEAEASLKDMENCLSDVEADLDKAMTDYLETQELDAETKTQLQEYQNIVQSANEDYGKALEAKAEVAAGYEAQIKDLESTVDQYDVAIAEKEYEKEGVDIPEGYQVDKDGNITNGENNLTPADGNKVPEGCEVKDGQIVNTETGEVVGTVAGTEDKPQYFMQQPVEQEQTRTWRDNYDTANELFNNPDANWEEALDGLTERDIKAIKNQYNDLNHEVIEQNDYYNEDDLPPSFEQKVNIELRTNKELLSEVQENLDKVDSLADQYAKYDKYGIFDIKSPAELANMTPEDREAYNNELNRLANSYVEDKCRFTIDDIPKGFTVPDELQDKINPEELNRKENETDDAYYLRIAEMLEEVYAIDTEAEAGLGGVQPSKYTLEQQMDMLNYIKDIGGVDALTALQRYGESGQFSEMFAQTLNATNDDGTKMYDVSQLSALMELNSEVFGSESFDYVDWYAPEFVDMLETASPDEIEQLLEYVDASHLADVIQDKYRFDNETEMLTSLMNSLNKVNDGKLVPPEVDNANNLYSNPDYSFSDNTTSVFMQNVLRDVQSGKLSNEEAQYLFAHYFGNPDSGEYATSEYIVSEFRNLKDGVQDDYIQAFFTIYSPATTTDAHTAPATQPDAGTTQPTVGTDDYNPGSTYLTGGTNEEPEDMTLPYAARS